MKKIINFLINPSKAVYIVLIALVVSLSSALAYKWFENRDLETSLNAEKVTIKELKADVAKALRAEKSCKKAYKAYKDDVLKKQNVLEQYKNSIGGLNNEKVLDIDSYINFADRLYQAPTK